MAQFSELSEPQPTSGGAPGSGSRFDVSAAAPGSRAVKAGVLTAAECDELRLRVAEARARTQELIVHYLASCGRFNTTLSRHREAAAARDEVKSALNSSVARYAHLLRALGEPPERTLVLIKAAFNEAAPRQDDDNRAALEDVVKWIVDAYYAA